ncbi:MAG: hypothetical protein LBD85_02310 [Oscillospiraceae bacterium]|jgi:hypothetical protein|nr:hypothetical protein [Oscillospiraceae bacterium]
MKKRGFMLIAALLIAAIMTGATAFAGVQASSELSDYTVEMFADGNGVVAVEFYVAAVGIADEVGVSKIVFQRQNGSSWTNVATYTRSNHSDFVGYNCSFHTGEASYTGQAGQQYRAIVTVFATKSSGTTSRAPNTNTVTA